MYTNNTVIKYYLLYYLKIFYYTITTILLNIFLVLSLTTYNYNYTTLTVERGKTWFKEIHFFYILKKYYYILCIFFGKHWTKKINYGNLKFHYFQNFFNFL